MNQKLLVTVLSLSLATSLFAKEEGFSFGIGLTYDVGANTSGHLSRIRSEVYINHSNPVIDFALRPIVTEANICLDYNPEKIDQLDRRINQLEQIASCKQAVHSKKEDLEKIAALAREVHFLAFSKQLSAMPLDDEDNHDLIATRNMMRQVQEKNGY